MSSQRHHPSSNGPRRTIRTTKCSSDIESPKGEHWRHTHPTQIPVEAPNMAALPIQHTGAHTFQGDATPPPRGSPPTPLHDPPHTTHMGNTRPRFKTYQKNTSKPGKYSPTYILDKEDINSHRLLASSRNITRTQEHQARNPSTLMYYWPTLIPASLPVHPPGESRPLLLPRSLSSMGW